MHESEFLHSTHSNITRRQQNCPIEVEIGLIEVAIGLIEVEIGLIEVEIGLIETYRLVFNLRFPPRYG